MSRSYSLCRVADVKSRTSPTLTIPHISGHGRYKRTMRKSLHFAIFRGIKVLERQCAFRGTWMLGGAESEALDVSWSQNVSARLVTVRLGQWAQHIASGSLVS